jgi:hypothetical protein
MGDPMKFKIVALTVAFGALAAALPAAAQVSGAGGPAAASPYGLTFSTGADYSSGSYGTNSKTKIFVAPMSLAFKTDAFRLSASVPYLRIDGAGAVVLGSDGRPLPGVPGATGVRSGLGDLSLAGTASLPTESLGGFNIDVTGRVKFPTSKSSKRLGTGETDFTVSTDISYPVGAWAPFVTLGYRMPGDPPGIDLQNSFNASIGASVAAGQTVMIVSYDYAEASSPLAEDAQELFAAVSAPATDRLNLTGYGIAGLSEGSPDFELGLLVTVKLR